jgi:hypothetical protein
MSICDFALTRQITVDNFYADFLLAPIFFPEITSYYSQRVICLHKQSHKIVFLQQKCCTMYPLCHVPKCCRFCHTFVARLLFVRHVQYVGPGGSAIHDVLVPVGPTTVVASLTVLPPHDGVNWINTTKMYSFNMRVRRQNYIVKMGIAHLTVKQRLAGVNANGSQGPPISFFILERWNNLSSSDERWKLDDTCNSLNFWIVHSK